MCVLCGVHAGMREEARLFGFLPSRSTQENVDEMDVCLCLARQQTDTTTHHHQALLLLLLRSEKMPVVAGQRVWAWSLPTAPTHPPTHKPPPRAWPPRSHTQQHNTGKRWPRPPPPSPSWPSGQGRPWPVALPPPRRAARGLLPARPSAKVCEKRRRRRRRRKEMKTTGCTHPPIRAD